MRDCAIANSIKRFRKIQSHLLLTLFVIGLTSATTCLAGETNFCQLSSQQELSSCRTGAQSTLQLALAQCDNVPDAPRRLACKRRAFASQKSALRLCDRQLSKRQQICQKLGPAPYSPDIDPADFITVVDNTYFPLTPGTTLIYETQTPDGFEHHEFTVTHNTATILGVTCVEIHNPVTLNGQLTGDTLDYFAQDKAGNVWFFKDDSDDVSGGRVVKVDGWTAGVNGASPGIQAEAHPAIGDFYRQDLLLSTAEEVAQVLELDTTVTVPAGTFQHCVEIEEGTGLEPDAREHKFYCPGVGLALDIDLVTGNRLPLVAIRRD
jgi:hypothetical protein